MLAEFCGTFLVTFVSMCVLCNRRTSPDSVPLATGTATAAAMTAFSTQSGIHINPCISLAFAMIGELKLLLSFFYLAAQLIGATAAGVVARVLIPSDRFVNGNGGLILVPASSSTFQAVFAEVVITFFL